MGVTLSGSQGLSSPEQTATGPNRLASPRVNGYLVKASSNPFTFYDSPLPGVNTPWDVMRISLNLVAVIFAAVSILNALKTEDLSRKLEVNYVKFQFRGGLLGDDEKTESDNDKDVDLNKTDDEEEDEFIHTPDNYVPTNDENIDDEEYNRINKEMYSDVNVELKETELEGEGKDDKEMTDVGHVDAEQEKVIQEVAGDQVKDVDQATVTAAPATQNTKVPLPTTISTTTAPDSLTLTTIHQRLFDLENKVKTLRNVDNSSAIRGAIKSEIPTIVKEYLGTSLDDTLHKVIQRHTVELIMEHSVLADVVEVLQQQHKPQKSIADIRKIKMEQVMTSNNVYFIASFVLLIIEYLVIISKRRAFWSLNEDILKITILTINTPYPSKKIRRIHASTHQRPQRKQAQYDVSREDQYAILDIWHVNILDDIKRGPYSKKLQYAISYPLDTPYLTDFQTV
ncbi:hypothetical protein Tco_0096681 [Tanacetum coccineum]